MKKYMQTAGANPVPFQEVATLTEDTWQKAIQGFDLSAYVGKTIITEKLDAAHYVIDATHYVDLTITTLSKE